MPQFAMLARKIPDFRLDSGSVLDGLEVSAVLFLRVRFVRFNWLVSSSSIFFIRNSKPIGKIIVIYLDSPLCRL